MPLFLDLFLNVDIHKGHIFLQNIRQEPQVYIVAFAQFAERSPWRAGTNLGASQIYLPGDKKKKYSILD
jgi:hypothetical protein